MTNTRTVPRSALLFAVDMQLNEAAVADGDIKLYPFGMVARTNGVANHPFWGRCIHDLAGMRQLKPSISVDYCHNPAEVVGFAEKIEVQPEGLKMAGNLVSLKDGDRAEEIFKKRNAGVPYEASIMTSWENLVIEELPDGFADEVNGQTVQGPVTIFRSWELWGVAICPYGTDSQTSIQFSAGLAGDVTVSVKGPAMTKPADAPVKSGTEFLKTFGEKGGLWFAQGKTFDEAFGLFAEDMKTAGEAKDAKLNELSTKIGELTGELDKAKTEYAAELEKLKTEHAAEVDTMKKEFAVLRGGDPASFNPPPKDQPVDQTKNQFAGLTPGMAKFANSIKLPSAPKAD